MAWVRVHSCVSYMYLTHCSWRPIEYRSRSELMYAHTVMHAHTVAPNLSCRIFWFACNFSRSASKWTYVECRLHYFSNQPETLAKLWSEWWSSCLELYSTFNSIKKIAIFIRICWQSCLSMQIQRSPPVHPWVKSWYFTFAQFNAFVGVHSDH